MRRRGGFTLLEVLVSSAILVLVLAAAASALVYFTSQHEANRRTTSLNASSALAMRVLTNELRLAGFGAPNGVFRANVNGNVTFLPVIRANPLSNFGVVHTQSWPAPFATVWPASVLRPAQVVPGAAAGPACAGGLGRLWGSCCLPDVGLQPDNIVIVRGDRERRTMLTRPADQSTGNNIFVRIGAGAGAWTPQRDDWLFISNGQETSLVCVTSFSVVAADEGLVTLGDSFAGSSCVDGLTPNLVPGDDPTTLDDGYQAGSLVSLVRSQRFSVGTATTPKIAGDDTYLWFLQRHRVDPITMAPGGALGAAPPGEMIAKDLLNIQFAFGFDANDDQLMNDGVTTDTNQSGHTADDPGARNDWDWRAAPCPAPIGGAAPWNNCMPNPNYLDQNAFKDQLKRLKSVRITVLGRAQAAAGCSGGGFQLAGENSLSPLEDETFPTVVDIVDNARYRIFQGEASLRNLSRTTL
ncbi:MAG: prepilin-type N-terminal cleavage/methylation domain-containing protein [Myxococcota bacterium]